MFLQGIAFLLNLLYNVSIKKSILKTRHEVRKSDMSILLNNNVVFSYAGLFRSETEWIHPRKTEKTYEIICVTKGKVYISEGDNEYLIEPGQVLILSPNVLHYGTRITSDVGFYWVHFTVKEGDLPFNKRYFESFDGVYLFKELLHYNNLPSIPDYAVNSVLIHILAVLCHLSEKSESSYNSIVETLLEWMRINADASLTVKAVADHFGYSPDHINRICKRNCGICARALINNYLLVKAKELLVNTEKYVKEIAAELAFPSDKAFIGYFKYHEGRYPSDFRNRFGKTHMNKR